MKKTNKILNLVMAMILMCLSMVCVSAEDIAENDEYIEFFENDIIVNTSEDAVEIVDSIDNNEEIMPMAANGCTVPIAGYGSTGRTEPQNLYEQLAMQECMSNPFGGEYKALFSITDSRWLGWTKYQYIHRSDIGNIVIHFNYDGDYWFDDFKFKN